MFKYLGILLFFKSTISDEGIFYKYEDNDNDGDFFLGDDSNETNETLKIEPVRGLDRKMGNHIDDISNMSDDNYKSKEALYEKVRQSITPKRVHKKRECNFTNNVEGGIETPVASAKDSITTYPFIASVLRLGSHYATGALIDKRWVLSAAGVFYNVRESIKLYKVRLGSVNCKKGGILIPLQQIGIHPAYSPGKPDFDLAMLRLAQTVELSPHIHPVSMTERKGDIEIGKFLTMYWPRLIVDGKSLPATAKERKHHTNLRVSNQRLMPWKLCSHALASRNEELTQNSFCLRPLRQHHTICLPDVGAPVVSQDGLWGVISSWAGEPCTFLDPSPVVVTRISPPTVRYWLEGHTEQDGSEMDDQR